MSVAGPLSAPDAARDLAALRDQLAGAPEAAGLRPLGLGAVLLGAGVLGQVAPMAAELCRTGDVALVADRRAMAGATGEVKAAVAAALGTAGMSVRDVVLGDERADVHADPRTLARAVGESAGAGLVVSVGSGTIVDIGKAVSALLAGIPHLVVQTAASVNGFADDQSVLLVDGVKRTTPTRWPERLLIDTDVLVRAPLELNRAGLGDLLATYTAPADWRLAHLVGQDERYSPVAVAMARVARRRGARARRGHPRGRGRRDREPGRGTDPDRHLDGRRRLHRALLGHGAHRQPSARDVRAPRRARPAARREGRRAGGAGGVLWARVRVAAAGRCAACAALTPSAAEMEPRVRAAFAELDPSGRDGDRLLERLRAQARTLARHARAAGRAVRSAGRRSTPSSTACSPRPSGSSAALRAARAPVRLTELGVPAERARWALANGHLMRDRFTVADLAFFLGLWDDDGVDALLAEVAPLGVGL